MKEFIAKYQKTIIGIGALSVLVLCYYQQKEIKKLRAETKIGVNTTLVDSLHDELFIEKAQNGRYELTFEHLKEVNPKLAKEMEEFMAHETE